MPATLRLPLVICAFTALTALGALAQTTVAPGMTEKDLLAEKGPPASKAALGNKAIYTWQDMRVTVESGAVIRVEVRDPQKEKANEVRRTQLAVQDRKRQEAERKAQEAEGRRYLIEQQRQMAEAANPKESDFDKDRRLRMEKYRRDVEIAQLEEQMRQLDAAADRAWKAGDGARFARLTSQHGELRAKRDELIRKNRQ